jgi:hypothetical protein
MLQILETLHLMCIYLYFYHISLQILNCIDKKFKNGKIPYSFLPSLFFKKTLDRSILVYKNTCFSMK